jgi:hypothetical protein
MNTVIIDECTRRVKSLIDSGEGGMEDIEVYLKTVNYVNYTRVWLPEHSREIFTLLFALNRVLLAKSKYKMASGKVTRLRNFSEVAQTAGEKRKLVDVTQLSEDGRKRPMVVRWNKFEHGESHHCRHYDVFGSSVTEFLKFQGYAADGRKIEDFINEHFGDNCEAMFSTTEHRFSYIQSMWSEYLDTIRKLDSGPLHKKTTFTVPDMLYKAVERFVEGPKRYFMTTLLICITPHAYHSNGIVIDKVNKTITRFEPHGATTRAYNHKELDRKFEDLFVSRVPFLSGYRYVAPWEFSGDIVGGIQGKEQKQTKYKTITKSVMGKVSRVEAEGFCLAWVYLYLFTRAVHPGEEESKIFGYLQEGSVNDLADRVRRFMDWLNR